MNFYEAVLRLLLGRRLPIAAGELQVPGIDGPVQVRRDAHGVPYIRAVSEPDGWYGLGFCHGQDRAFQLETVLRMGRGTLSGLFGRAALPLDRMSRRIGLYRAGQGHLTVMPESQRLIVRAYVRGLNAGLQAGVRKKAHEFVILRSESTLWEEADVMAYLNYMGIVLSGWTAKLTRLYVLKHDGAEALRALDADYPDWGFVTDPVGQIAGPAVDRVLQDIEALTGFLGNGMSNNWVLNRARTANGNPILANDPHLAPRLPAPWYLAHLRYPGLSVAGASFPGMPLIPSGFNGTSAWGVTAGMVDGIDLFVEKLDREKKTVRDGDGSAPCRVLREVYHVRGLKKPFEEEILVTPRGPIISDLSEGLTEAISMKATWMTPRPVNGLTNFHKATNFQGCRENFKSIYVGSQNVAYADTSDTIGWQLIGEAPRRRGGWGVLPMPGWAPEFGWETDFVTLEELPWAVNPPAGFIATANNQPQPDGQGPYLGRDFVPYRHARIVEILAARTDWCLSDMQSLQLDRVSVPWREMHAHVLSVRPEDLQAKRAREILEQWDGVVGAESCAAAVYEYFVIALAQSVAAAKAPGSTAQVLGKGFSSMFSGSFFYVRHVALLVRLLRERPDGWFEYGWDAAISRALGEACRRLEADLGPDPDAWRWGDVHPLVLSHQLGVKKPLDRIFNRGPFPSGGDHDTVAQAGRSVGRFGSNVAGMANLRMGVEVGEWERNFFVIAGGQSGNPLSPNYDDQLAVWLRGEAISLAWSEEAIEERTIARLVLRPAAP